MGYSNSRKAMIECDGKTGKMLKSAPTYCQFRKKAVILPT